MNVLEELFDLLRDWQVCILGWVVRAWNFLLVLRLLLFSSLSLLLLLHVLACLCLILICLLTSIVLDIDINVNLILIFIRVYFLTVFDLDSEIKRLVLDFLSFDICGLPARGICTCFLPPMLPFIG